MIARKSLPLKNDLIPFLRRSVEARHHEQQICCQRPHHGHLFCPRSDDRGHQLCRCVVDVQEGCKRRVVVRDEVARDCLGAPLGEEGLDSGVRALGLQAERVAAEVDAWV